MELSEKNISDMLEDIPTFSSSVMRILELTANVDCPTKELVGHITHDPILTGRILKLVNSAYFGLSRRVTSIQQSVVYVGINTIKNLAVSVAAMGSLPQTNKAGLDMADFWLHSLEAAVVAKLLAQKNNVAPVEVSTFFISALLHDIGKIIFSQAYPTTYVGVLEEAKKKEKPLQDIEQEVFGVNHATLGGLLAEKWKLPEPMVDAIRNHHGPHRENESGILNRVVFVANQVTKYIDHDYTEISMPSRIPSSIETWLGEPIEQVANSLLNLEKEIESAKVFIRMPAKNEFREYAVQV